MFTLKIKIFVKAYLMKPGIAIVDRTKDYKYKTKFIELEKKAK